MIPVNPPAESASKITAGNQKRANKVFRSSGGALTIAFGEYDFNLDPKSLDDIRWRPPRLKNQLNTQPRTTWISTVWLELGEGAMNYSPRTAQTTTGEKR